MIVNVFWLALLAMVVNALWVWLAMVVNGFATAWLWGWALMLRASHAVGTFVDTLRTWGLQLAWGFASCAVFCASRGGVTLMTANWPLMQVNGFWLALLAMVVNAFFVGYGANAR